MRETEDCNKPTHNTRVNSNIKVSQKLNKTRIIRFRLAVAISSDVLYVSLFRTERKKFNMKPRPVYEINSDEGFPDVDKTELTLGGQLGADVIERIKLNSAKEMDQEHKGMLIYMLLVKIKLR